MTLRHERRNLLKMACRPEGEAGSLLRQGSGERTTLPFPYPL